MKRKLLGIIGLIVVTAMNELHRRIPDYQLATSELEWIPSTTFRSPVALNLEFA